MKNVVIIGSGLGGLTAGNLLAMKGHKVTIFESHSMPGGYTAGFYRKGYYFESGTVGLEASASVFKVMEEIGVLDKIDFVKKKN
ncbi:MAG TPA: oleate hydratase, partial [Bacillota bacterium]|nr:oleate hydratase [Bacillota bacterium]